MLYSITFDSSQFLSSHLKVNPHIALAVVGLKRLRGFQFKGKAELLEEGNLYNDVVCYLQTLPLKLPDPQYVVKIKVEEVYHLGLGNKTTTPSSTRERNG